MIGRGCPMISVERLIEYQRHLIVFTVDLIVVKNEYKHKRHEHINIREYKNKYMKERQRNKLCT